VSKVVQEQEANFLLDEIAPDRMTQEICDNYNERCPLGYELELEFDWKDEGFWLERRFLKPVNGQWELFLARYANWDDIGWGLIILDIEGWECMSVKAREVQMPTEH